MRSRADDGRAAGDDVGQEELMDRGTLQSNGLLTFLPLASEIGSPCTSLRLADE